MGRSGYKWLSHDIQNEIIDILGRSVLRSVVADIKSREYFAIMVDETCDISIRGQLIFCIRTVNKNVDIFENSWAFMRFRTLRPKLKKGRE